MLCHWSVCSFGQNFECEHGDGDALGRCSRVFRSVFFYVRVLCMYTMESHVSKYGQSTHLAVTIINLQHKIRHNMLTGMFLVIIFRIKTRKEKNEWKHFELATPTPAQWQPSASSKQNEWWRWQRNDNSNDSVSTAATNVAVTVAATKHQSRFIFMHMHL